jgi:hypothetical protein
MPEKTDVLVIAGEVIGASPAVQFPACRESKMWFARPLRRRQLTHRLALYRFAAFAGADGGRASVVDGPLTTLLRGGWPIHIRSPR